MKEKSTIEEFENFIKRMAYNEKNLGINGNSFIYQYLKENQNPEKEFINTQIFLRKIFLERIKKEVPKLYNQNLKLEFINYGDTQQVYVLTSNNKMWTVLVTQPGTTFGIGKKEYKNLIELSQKHPETVIKPEYYFQENNQELYITPYIYQARCIASQDHGYGVYIPEPYYRFESFTSHDKKTVNTCMIANLIKLYNEEKKQGIASCKIGGGDFILEKDWDTTDKSIEITLEKMKLIAARDMIKMSLEEYEQQLLIEFSERTYYSKIEDKDESILINHKNRVPMTFEEIEKGIELGRQLRKTKKEFRKN